MGSASDMFAQSLVDMGDGIRRRQQAEKNAAATDAAFAEWQKALQQSKEDNAANIAEKYALRQQLARYAPNHPLLKNQQLRERLQDLGARAFAISGNFDDARQAGETFFPPGMPPTESMK